MGRRSALIPLHAASKSDIEGRPRCATSIAMVKSKRSICKEIATRTLRAIPKALIAGSCVAAFPQSAVAFTSPAEAAKTRNLLIGGTALVAATSAQIIRVTRDGIRASAAASSTDTVATTAVGEEKRSKGATKPEKIPITVLAGFLGAGKTTALKQLLENTEGIKVGTIVNDMASINIDAKLISNPMSGDGKNTNAVGKGSTAGTVELQNGCACCSLSDELLTSVSDLMKGRDLDAIVVELSGVADPAAVQTNWKQALVAKHPATEVADLGRVVTVVDSHTFGSDWMTWDTAAKREWAGEDDKW